MMASHPNESRQRHPCRRSDVVGAALVALAVGLASAQYALDANQNVYGSRINPKGPELKMGDELYTVTSSGGMAYNRAVAFRDSTYRIYQRSTIDQFRYSGPLTSSPSDANAGALMYQRQYSIKNDRSLLQGATPNRPSMPPSMTPAAPKRTAPNAIHPERYGRTLSQPVYSASPAPLRAQPTAGATRLPSNRVR